MTLAPVRLAALAALATAALAPAALAQDARGAYRGLPDAEVRALEYDLIWAGETDAVTDGRIGRRDIEAIRAFEGRVGGTVDGVLTDLERRPLERRAERARAAAGYEVVLDRPTGMRLGLPRAYLDVREPAANGTLWRADGRSVVVRTFRLPRNGDLRRVYEQQMGRENRTVSYEVFRDDFFVVSGTQGASRFYVRAATDGNEVRGFLFRHNPDVTGDVDRVIVAMSNDFDPFAADPSERPARADRRPPPPTADRGRPCGPTYRVRPGDTLYAIAVRCGVTVPGLLVANPSVAPRSLAVGQTLDVPIRRDVFPPAPGGEPLLELTGAAPAPGGAVTIRLNGFSPGAIVEGGFARSMDRVPVERVLRADARGAAELTLPLPERFGPGERVVLAFFSADGRQSATAAFTVRRPRPPRETVSVVGMLTSEGGACPAMRGVDGALYTLVGRTGDLPAPGTAIRVNALAGTPKQSQTCDQGRTVQVRDIVQR